ncbi:molybdenum cofactor guanylyltransferase MobA [Oleomonas cavernae]|uniref:molybdenum cofactor guanylyltransferase MobA n=1 Tax=Oleomonas cavernae TaxID=2320859 RepID=UPI0018F6D515|nr:molybdenum cofactor guanylyltransferase MobA [Oleomonas cavernae]
MTAPCGVILAGGQARRLGGGDKGLLALGGRPILGHMIERLAPQCARLALNANGDPARFASFALPVLADPLPGQPGPLAGVLAGLDWASRFADCRWLLSVPGDQPFVPRDLAARLSTAAVDMPLVCAASGGQTHWLTALWSITLREPLRRALVEEGLAKVEHFATRAGFATVDYATAPVDPFFNINDPGDLRRAEDLIHRQ